MTRPPISSLFALLVSFVSIAVAIASLAVSYRSYSANQEGLSVLVRRDYVSAVDIGHTEGPVYPKLEREDVSLLAKWNVSIVNTSLTAATPITAIRISSLGALGLGDLIDMGIDENAPETQIRLYRNSGADVEFPIEIRPGEVMKFTLAAPIAISKLAFPSKPTGIPSPQKVFTFLSKELTA